ncbi:hypothetical protein DRP43_01295, partial [candidate division TA06 bacterium]
MRELIDVPTLPLRDLTVFPYMEVPIIVGREYSIKAINKVLKSNEKLLFVVSQKIAGVENPREKDLYKYGTLVNVEKVIKSQDETIKILVRGQERARIVNFKTKDAYLSDLVIEPLKKNKGKYVEALVRKLLKCFNSYASLKEYFPPEFLYEIQHIKQYEELAYIVASNIDIKQEQKQNLIEIKYLRELLFELNNILITELEYIAIEKKIENSV